MNIKIKSVQVEFDVFLIIFFLFIFLCGYLFEYLIIFICMTLHEFVHLISSKLLGKRVKKLRLLPIGLNAIIEDQDYSIYGSIVIYLSGPLFNLLLYILGLLICTNLAVEYEYIRFFLISNLYLSVFNLIPVLPLDGGKILFFLLAQSFGINRAFKYTRRVSFFFTFIILLSGTFQLLINRRNFSLIIIGVYFLYYLFTERMWAAIMNIKYLISRRSRLFKRGIYPVRDLVVIKSMRLSEILKNLDYDRFHFIHVLDDNMRVMKIFTEQEIMDEIIKKDSDITFEEIVNNQAE